MLDTMSDEELQTHAISNLRRQKIGKRAKTFTGCWTCRSRKVKCDLRRPNCERCEKSGLECGGYDIKLRWSKCVQFDIYGSQVSNTPSLSTNEEQQYRRRNIDFVRYGEEYQYYEEMDNELSALHKPPPEKISDGKTWIIKKFGVFRGTEKVVELPKRAKKRLAVESERSNQDGNTITDTATEDAGSFDFLENDSLFMKLATGNEWISKELEDDVLLSTAALQGFPITNLPLSSASTTMTTPLDQESHKLGITDCQPATFNINDSAGESTTMLQKALELLFEKKTHEESHERPYKLDGDHDISSGQPGQEKITIHCSPYGSTMPSVAIQTIPSTWHGPDIFSQGVINTPFSGPPTTGLTIHGLTRFLLDYYFRNVADLMTVVALATNPWKTLYFPRALQAVGDLAGLGYTSNSRNSLLNALLAVSCFNLSSKFSRDSEQSRYFVNLGIEFRSQASGFLKVCLAKTVKKERYKDVLTAILSMNSIDVVWGTMADCQYHLTVCEDYIKARMRRRPRISEKAKTLHRLFSFLKLIQDSTSLDKVREEEITIYFSPNRANCSDSVMAEKPEAQIEGCKETGTFRKQYKESLDEIDGKIKIVENMENAKTSSGANYNMPMFADVISESCYSSDQKNSECNMLSTDDLYGLPKSLISLFSDCVHLARHKEYYKIKHIALPSKFVTLRRKLENRLINWSSEWKFSKEDSEEFINDTTEGVYHHTMSFYNSLLIYFFTMIEEQNHTDVQSYVNKVLFHLTSIRELIVSKGVKIVPLMWQGFIAACESTETETQQEFRRWAAGLATNGMGSYWGARQVMFEVWRRRSNNEGGDSWYDVYKDWEMNLMLS